MFYRPEFCCDCGEKVERVDWKPWTSSRFCELCETKHPLSELVQKALPLLGILGLIIGITGYWPTSQTSVSPVTKRALAAEINAQPLQTLPTLKTTDSGNNQSQPSLRIENSNVPPAGAAPNAPKTGPVERPEP